MLLPLLFLKAVCKGLVFFFFFSLKKKVRIVVTQNFNCLVTFTGETSGLGLLACWEVFDYCFCLLTTNWSV